MNLAHQDLVNIIRGVHQDLRKATFEAGNFEKAWADHVANTEQRKRYSTAMLKLATEVWHGKGECRIKWTYDICLDYFFGNGLDRCLLRDARIRKMKNLGISQTDYKLCNEDLQLAPNNYKNLNRKLELLDVGSCYNPFSKFPEFSCTAIDLTPATKDVIQCDFLSMKIHSRLAEDENYQKCKLEFREESFDIVVFSLVLEYLPVPYQRAIFFYKAWQLLHENGLCIVITPDSKHVNYNSSIMKKWKRGLDLIGFQRIRYEKLKHLHCMAFRKGYKCSIPEYSAVLAEYLPIPQDNIKDYPDYNNISERSEEENNVISYQFLELPSFEDA